MPGVWGQRPLPYWDVAFLTPAPSKSGGVRTNVNSLQNGAAIWLIISLYNILLQGVPPPHMWTKNFSERICAYPKRGTLNRQFFWSGPLPFLVSSGDGHCPTFPMPLLCITFYKVRHGGRQTRLLLLLYFSYTSLHLLRCRNIILCWISRRQVLEYIHVEQISMSEVDDELCKAGLKYCKEYLGGAWMKATISDFHMEHIRWVMKMIAAHTTWQISYPVLDLW